MRFRKEDTRGGLLKDRAYAQVADDGKRNGEICGGVLPLEIEGKQYAIALYFLGPEYWRRTIKNFAIYPLSVVFPSFYMRAASYGEILQGVRVMKIKSGVPIPNEGHLYAQAFRLTRAWIDIYLVPWIDPKKLRIHDQRLKILRRLGSQFKKRKFPRIANHWEQEYFNQLKSADFEAIAGLEIIERQNILVHNLVKYFKDVSDRPPTDRAIYHSKEVSIRLKKTFLEMSEWCEKRAASWPNFVDAYTHYRVSKEENKPRLNRLSWRLLLAIPGIIVAIFASIPMGIAISVIRDVGIKYLYDLFMKPRWQTKQLKKASITYLSEAEKAQAFIDIFSLRVQQPQIRT